MISLLSIFLILNLIFIFSFIVGQNFIFNKGKWPRLVAYSALLLANILIVYLLLIAVIFLLGLVYKNFYVIPLILPAIAVFVIGKKVTYSNLKFYSNIQLLSLFGSLFYALFLTVMVY